MDMKRISVSMIPDEYKNPVPAEQRGILTEESYRVGNYINAQRQLVTDQNIDSEQAGRKTVSGDPIIKKCCVYLPKGYSENSSTRYNVLYLLHGVGGNRYEWMGAGKSGDNYILCNIFDNLIANGEIDPMIIVFPEGRSAHDWTDDSFNTAGTNLLGFYYFDYELRYDLIPFIESKYRTIADIRDNSPEGIELSRMHRALGGLSMGGMQTLNLIAGGYRCDSTLYTGRVSAWDNGLDGTVKAPGMLDLFAYIGAFSNAPTSSDGSVIGASIKSCGYKLHLLYTTCGCDDGIAYDIGYRRAVEGLAEAAGTNLGDFYRVEIKSGQHDFYVWYHGAYNFVRLSFNEKKSGPWPDIIDISFD